MAKLESSGREVRIDLWAFGWALAVTLVMMFLICVAVALLYPALDFSHAWIGLFTTAPAGSVRSFLEGIGWSIVFAWVAALIFSPVYNCVAASRS